MKDMPGEGEGEGEVRIQETEEQKELSMSVKKLINTYSWKKKCYKQYLGSATMSQIDDDKELRVFEHQVYY